MGALGHMLTPFCSVCSQFFVFIPGDVHVLQISSDDVYPIFPWASRLSLVAPQFLLCIAWRGILESSILNTWPNHLSLLSLMMSSNFRNSVFLLISSFLTLSFHVIPSSLRWNLRSRQRRLILSEKVSGPCNIYFVLTVNYVAASKCALQFRCSPADVSKHLLLHDVIGH